MRELELLKNGAGEFNIALNDDQVENFRIYLELLTEFNSHTNLVSSVEAETVIAKHFLDSLAIGLAHKEINLNQQLSLIDIGTGGGFPGIPLLIAFSSWKLCAVDSVAKKLEFIKILAEKLGITNRIEIVPARAEELARLPEKREGFDLAVTRAVAKLNVISEYCLPFVKENGYFVSYKAKSAQSELEEAQNAISLLGGKCESVLKYSLTGEEQRNLVLIKKVASTPGKYPRRTGVPAKKPLVR